MFKLKFISLFTFLILIFPLGLKSQTNVFPKHSIILDAGGIGGYGSLNYERTFYSKKVFSFPIKLVFLFIDSKILKEK